MGIKVYKPVSNGRRNMSVDDYSDITSTKPVKALTIIKKKSGGRNNTGRITVRHIGGGNKQFIRIIDFKRNKFDVPGTVKTIEYDPNRNARIALIQYHDGEKRYIVAPVDLHVGDEIISSKNKVEIKIGNCTTLENLPAGVFVYNLELVPGRGGQMVRSAGAQAKLMVVDGDYAQIKLPSSEIRRIPKDCMATIGRVSNPEIRHVKIGKAGRKRNMGIRPTVRGKAMNPVDHPHGGGEGANPIGLKAPKTPWGKLALGVKTRRNKHSSKLIMQRRKKK